MLQAALLGVVQGLTEFLPISSTAHLLVAERLFGFSDPGSVFTEMIQLGSILAIVWLYRIKLWQVVSGLRTRAEARRFMFMLVLAFLPAAVVGLFGSDYVESILHRSFNVIGVAFVVGGLVMLAVERGIPVGRTRGVDDATAAQAFGVGLFQMLALVPGVSRSGATIVGGLVVGLDRPTAAEFSFFLAMPTLAATFAHSALELRHQLTSDRLAEIGVGFTAAFLSSLVVVSPFLQYVRREGFAPFAWYRIAAGLTLLGAVAAGWLV